MTTPHVSTIARHIARLRAELARALAEHSTTPRAWAATYPDLDQLAAELLWCRDAALVVARRGHPATGAVPWHALQTLTGVPDSTLSDRFATFTEQHGNDR